MELLQKLGRNCVFKNFSTLIIKQKNCQKTQFLAVLIKLIIKTQECLYRNNAFYITNRRNAYSITSKYIKVIRYC